MKDLSLFREVKGLLNTFAENKQVSKNELAKMLDVSAATLSNIDNDRADKLTDAMLLKIRNAIRPQSWSVVATANFNTIQSVCNVSRVQHRMSAVIGDTGVGKTTALRHYYRNTENTYLLTCQMSMRPKHFFEKLAMNIGVNISGTTYDILIRTADELKRRKDPLIIIDEAGRMSARLLNYLHDLWNEIEMNAGVVLAGVGYFKTNLDKAVEKNKVGMPELRSRIGFWTNLELPSRAEIEAVCTHNGLTDKEIIKSIAKAKDFRYVSQVIKNAAL